MTLIDRYLAKRFAATLLRTLAAFVFLYVIIDFLTARQNSIEKYDIPLGVVFQYYVTHVTTFIFKFQALALALLVSTLLVLGRCAQDTEITALMAGGLSMTRITRALVVFAALLAGGVFVFENTLGVESAKLADRIEREYFKRFTLDSDAGPSWTNLGDQNWTCHILKFNPAALTGTDVFIHAFTPGNMEEIRARRIYWDPERAAWILEDGRWISQRRDAENPQTVTRDISRITQREAPFRESPEMLFALTEPPETRSASALHRDLVRAEAMGVPTTTSWVAFHTKFSRPVLCFVIIWLAIPFALRLRRGGLFIGFGASIALGLAYVMLYAVAVGLGAIGLLPPVVAAWLATVVFLIAGVLLFRRACA